MSTYIIFDGTRTPGVSRVSYKTMLLVESLMLQHTRLTLRVVIGYVGPGNVSSSRVVFGPSVVLSVLS